MKAKGQKPRGLLEDGNARRRPPVAERIAAKLDVLRRWRAEGIPEAHSEKLPRSFSRLRTWQDVELGLHAIGSWTDFSPSHPAWGILVVEMKSHFHALDAERRLKAETPEKRQDRIGRDQNPVRELAAKAREQAREIRNLKSRLETIVAQWHAERSVREAAESLAASEATHRARAESERDEARKELARAKRADGTGGLRVLPAGKSGEDKKT